MKHLIFFIIYATPIFAQVNKYSNEFLKIGVGARALAMSNANVASATDITAAYLNPAGLAKQAHNYELGLMHAEYFAGIAKYDYLAASKKIDPNSTVALSVLRFGVDNIMNTTELIDRNGNVNYNKITLFSAVDMAFIGSYARNISTIDGLSFGANLKVIRRTIGDFGNCWGFGTDVGLHYTKKLWQFGAILKDASGTYSAWRYTLSNNVIETFNKTKNEIPQNNIEVTPPSLNLGSAKTTYFFNNLFSVLFECNLINTFDGKRNALIKSNLWSMDLGLGAEVQFKNMLFFRAGLGNFQQVTDIKGNSSTTTQPNIGIGIAMPYFTLDYCLTNVSNLSGSLYSNLFSLKINFINSK